MGHANRFSWLFTLQGNDVKWQNKCPMA
uniref:Uncharacterized protein n=1 Tax=Arundo donax TaxID=35708 RepID=A0A0A8ZWQ7_ARUDO